MDRYLGRYLSMVLMVGDLGIVVDLYQSQKKKKARQFWDLKELKSLILFEIVVTRVKSTSYLLTY